jgi:Flp pilus assembly protein TadG
MADAAVAEVGAEFHGLAEAFAAAAARALADGNSSRIASGDLEQALTAAIKLYAAKAEAEGQCPAPVAADKITPTEVVLVVSELLRAADISLFDLAMWYRRGERA